MDKETREGVRLLTAASVHRQDEAALDLIDLFVAGQRPAVEELTATATGTVQGRIRTSLSLIDTVADRAEDLRSAMACGAGTTEPDSLGPQPERCPAVRTGHETRSAPDATGKSAGDKRSDGRSAAEPAQTGVEVDPDGDAEGGEPAADGTND